jgi:hypothetical protein
MQTNTVHQLLTATPVALPLSLVASVGARAAAGALAVAQRYVHAAGQLDESLSRMLTIVGAGLMLLATHAIPHDDELDFDVSDRWLSN